MRVFIVSIGVALRTVVATAWVLLIIVLSALSPNAHGATTINCAPTTKYATQVAGSKLRTAKSDTGRWFAWWCGYVEPGDSTKFHWKLQTYAVLKELGKPLEDEIDKLGGDVESFTVITVLLTMPNVVPVPGSQEEYRWLMLRWSACKALSTKPYDVPFSPDIPANFCGNGPTPPAPTTDWTATGATIFTYSAGKLTGVTTRKATKGAACDDRAVAIVGPTVYRSLVGGPATEATACTKP